MSLALAAGFAAGAGNSTTTGTGAIPLPASGNLSVAQLTVTAKAGAAARTPTLRLAGRALSGSAFVVGGVVRDPGSKTRFIATIALFDPPAAAGVAGDGAAGSVAVQLPAGYTVTRQSVAANVLYQNPRPTSSLPVPGAASVLGGTPPPKIAARRLLIDARKLALDLSVPVADMELLGFPYVSAALTRIGGSRTSFAVTIALANLGQVNSVRLTFPAGTTFASAVAPPLADASPLGTALRMSATQGFFTEATAYRFTFALGQALPAATPLTLEASTHYFENVLPFTERVWIPA